MALRVLPLQPKAEERKPPWPIFCRRCCQLITPEEPVRRCYRGFLYHEHMECPRQEYGPLSGLQELVDAPPRTASQGSPAHGNGNHNREHVDRSQPGQSSPTAVPGIP
jgi:hypothetical protein